MSTCNFTQSIPASQCIGDSLVTINSNFNSLDSSLCNLQTNTNTLSSSFLNLRNQVTDVLSTAPIFVPANYNTLSNQTVFLSSLETPFSLTYFGALGQVPVIRLLGHTSAASWFSPIQTTLIPSPPPNTVGALINFWVNVNAKRNSMIYFYIRKNSSEPFALKINIDPAGGDGNEQDSSVVVPTFFDLNTDTFQWRWVDERGGTTTNPPEYQTVITLLGYYVKVI